MNDCINADVRDRLPELLHDRLDESERAAVMAHVGQCADCRAELDLLRNARQMLVARAPRVDVDYVVQALPKPAAPAAQSIRPVNRRHVWTDWRVAAAVTLLVAGGSSVALLNRGPSGTLPPAAVATSAAPAAPSAIAHDSAAAPAATPPVASSQQESARQTAPTSEEAVASVDAPQANADAGNSARLNDLNQKQLETLLKDIDKLQPVPVASPDPVSLRVTTTSSSSEGA